MENKEWCITEFTPKSLIFAPKALHEKIKYLRWTDSLLDAVSNSEPLTPIYRHNLYESWIVFFWSYLEAITEDTCNELEELNVEEIKRKDIKAHSTFDGTTKYLCLVCKEIFPSTSLQKQLNDYRIIRNICAHEAGGQVENNIDEKSIYVEYGGGFQNVSNSEETSFRRLQGIEIEKGNYKLTRDFCEGLLQFGAAYVLEFQIVAKSIGEKAKRFLKNNEY